MSWTVGKPFGDDGVSLMTRDDLSLVARTL
jgi:hypothetical protein